MTIEIRDFPKVHQARLVVGTLEKTRTGDYIFHTNATKPSWNAEELAELSAALSSLKLRDLSDSFYPISVR